MIILVGLVVLVLCTARYSRALSHELIGLPIRAYAEEKYTRASKAYKLVTCHWCNSFWIALIHTLLALTACSIFLGTWWPMAATIFIWPAVAYMAAWIIDRTVD